MSTANLATVRIAQAVRRSFFDFIEKREAAFPTVLERMAADRLGASYLLRPFAWVSLKNMTVRNRKFIFLSDRHPDLLKGMPAGEAAIVGMSSEFILSRKRGLGFCLAADLYLASHAILFGKRGIPSDRIVRRWMEFFGRQANPCYLILPQDTSPMSLLLAKVAAACPNMRSVCIQHGLFNAGSDLDDIEGRNSRINLVYDQSQGAEMLRRLPAAVVEVMGFPADLPAVSQTEGALPMVILVGTGFTDQPPLLALSLEIYRELISVLGETVARVEYRPHPAEHLGSDPEQYGLTINKESKSDLLSGSRKVFIGFNSTLLYEAALSGHFVIILDHEKLPGYKIRPIGLRMDCRTLAELPAAIAHRWNSDIGLSQGSIASARIRMVEALGRVEARLSNGQVGSNRD